MIKTHAMIISLAFLFTSNTTMAAAVEKQGCPKLDLKVVTKTLANADDCRKDVSFTFPGSGMTFVWYPECKKSKVGPWLKNTHTDVHTTWYNAPGEATEISKTSCTYHIDPTPLGDAYGAKQLDVALMVCKRKGKDTHARGCPA